MNKPQQQLLKKSDIRRVAVRKRLVQEEYVAVYRNVLFFDPAQKMMISEKEQQEVQDEYRKTGKLPQNYRIVHMHDDFE